VRPTWPEGLTGFSVASRDLVAVANEVSDTTSLFEIDLSRHRKGYRD
jgi:hypothetical protein